MMTGRTKLPAATWARLLVLVCGAIALSGCPPEDDTIGTGSANSCTQGQMRGCSCAPNVSGVSACDATGVFGMCVCSAPTAGAGGVAGMAGTMAGTGGAPGAGGASGMSEPVGGTTAGMAGTGTGGAGGVAGMSMMAGEGGASGTTAGAAGMEMTGGDGASGMTGSGDGGEIPAGDYCASVATWDPAWVEFEEEVLRLTNEVRAMGADCGTEGTFGPADPLTMSGILRCSARLHSKDMGEMGYFAHDAPDGRDPFERMEDAGYSGSALGENIAKGQQTPDEVVAGWVDSDGHCSNIMNASFTEIGIGYWEGEADNTFFNGNKLWTQNFGRPLGGGGTGSCPFPPQFCP